MARPPLLFVHGFKGATLVDTRNNSLEWLTAAKAVGLLGRFPRIALPITWDSTGTVQDRDALRPGEPLWRVSGFYSVYAPLLAWGSKRRAADGGFSAVVYDWRRNLSEASDSLLATLRTLPVPPQIIAHSMGGLVTSVALIRAGGAAASHLVHSVVFAGVPFTTSTAFLEDMTPGAPLHLAYLDSKTSFTFPSVLSMFPVLGDAPLGDAQFWIDHQIGLFSVPEQTTTQERLTHLRNALGCARRFREVLTSPIQNRISLPVAVLASNSHPTPNGPDVRMQMPKKDSEWHAVPKEPGDGRVPFEAATQLPPCFASTPTIVSTNATHGDLLNNVSLVEEILSGLENK